jgi:hypothetical protein
MPSRSDCATAGTDTTVSPRQDPLTSSHAEVHRADSSATDTTVSPRQEALLAGLNCYYSTGSREVQAERPHCQRIAVVAFGNIVLCAMCDAMRSAVGRTNAPRKVPGAELSTLVEDARALALAEQRLDKAARRARAAGASWGQLGDAMGITRQAAQQRFGGVDPPEDRRDP